MSLDKIRVEKVAQNVIGFLDNKAKLQVKKQDIGWDLMIETENAALLIGRRGQTLLALEHLLRLILAREEGMLVSLSVDIAGYREILKKELEDQAHEAASRVIATGKKEDLPVMSSYERRIIHLALTDIAEVKTESEGEEPYRRIVIYKST